MCTAYITRHSSASGVFERYVQGLGTHHFRATLNPEAGRRVVLLASSTTYIMEGALAAMADGVAESQCRDCVLGGKWSAPM